MDLFGCLNINVIVNRILGKMCEKPNIHDSNTCLMRKTIKFYIQERAIQWSLGPAVWIQFCISPTKFQFNSFQSYFIYCKWNESHFLPTFCSRARERKKRVEIGQNQDTSSRNKVWNESCILFSLLSLEFLRCLECKNSLYSKPIPFHKAKEARYYVFCQRIII